ncbi:hypothetical protein ACRC6Q_04565 [Planococcus sp. SE5232]|uniref:hypothetical protein n=1 Tax=unclassified Planococcus (in: firmicutes) TaxID=2662419 RepID=UPI003D6BC76F
MLNINFKKKLKVSYSWITVLIIAFLVYFNHSTFYASVNTSLLLPIYIVTITTGLLFIYKIVVLKCKIDVKVTVIFIVLVTIILITMLFNSDYTGGNGVVILGLIIGYFSVHIFTLEEFADKYVKIIIFLAIYSLLANYFFRPITFNMPNSIFPIVLNPNNLVFVDARFSVLINDINYYRNFGIFGEPGLYQVFLNLALIFELFYKKNKISFFNVSVIYITTITTFSPPGYIVGTLIILLFFISKNKSLSKEKLIESKKKLFYIISTVICILLIFFLTNDVFSYMFSQSSDKLFMKESSFQGRTGAVLGNLSVWMQSPFFGKGITGGISESVQNMASITTHNTSTIGALLVIFGPIFTFIYIYSFFNLFQKFKQGLIVSIGLLIAIMISINTQLLIYNELIYLFVFLGLVNKRSV